MRDGRGRYMAAIEHPRLLARIAGAFYVAIIVFAMFAYRYVRGGLINPADMAQTASNLMAHEKFFRLGFSAAAVAVICNLPMAWIFYRILKVVNPHIALFALICVITSTAIEAMNLLNYITPLFSLTLPEYVHAFDAGQRQALARGAIRSFGYGLSISLVVFGIFCLLSGYLWLRSRVVPAIIGLLILAAGATYEVENFVFFLGLPDIPFIGWTTLIAESSLALWLLIVGIDERAWRALAEGSRE